MIDPNEDELSYFANWYLTSGDIKAIYTPSKNPYNYSLDGITGTVIYRNKNFQVELFICKPNTFIPEHIHPDVDSFEVFLYGMKFTHGGKIIINDEQAVEEIDGMPAYAYQTIRVKPNDYHGGASSKNGGSFLSIQRWLNDINPTTVSDNWHGDTMGDDHKKQIGKNNGKKVQRRQTKARKNSKTY